MGYNNPSLNSFVWKFSLIGICSGSLPQGAPQLMARESADWPGITVDVVGPDHYLPGCSAVFAPCIGFVDGMRTAGDINPNFVAFGELVLGNAGNFYLSKVCNTDSDDLTFRAAADEDDAVSREGKKSDGNLTVNEAGMWPDFRSLFGSCRSSSDTLATFRPERIALVKELCPGVFDWGDTPKEYALSASGKPAPIKLDARHSVILKYGGEEPFAQLCQKLQFQ